MGMFRFQFGLTLLVALIFQSLYAFGQRPDNYPPDDTSVKIEGSNLPIVFINVGGQQIMKDERITAKMTIINNVGGGNYSDTVSHPNQNIEFEGIIGLKYRGNGSFGQADKKPYSIHFLTDSIERDGKKREEAVLGMPAHNDWALLSMYKDKSLLRDMLSFSLAQGYLEYVPDGKFCELILDGTYYGIFLFCERPRRGKTRLDIKKPGEEGDKLTGGYLVEIDRPNEEHYYISKYHPKDKNGVEQMDKYVYFQYKDPDFDELTQTQIDYLHNRIDAFEDALAADSFKDTENGYQKYIDDMSFIDYQLINELSNNKDAYRLSTKMYKYRDSVDPRFKLTIWDFDIAWGKTNSIGFMTDVWAYENNSRLRADEEWNPFWYERLMQDENYVNKLKNRWVECRNGRFSYNSIVETIDSLVNVLNMSGAIIRNYQAWPRMLSNFPWEYYHPKDYDDEINYLKDWIKNRIAWMDLQLINSTNIDKKFDNNLDNSITIFDINGIKHNMLQKGVNIVRLSNGKTTKIIH